MLHTLLSFFDTLISNAQTTLYIHVLQPIFYRFDWMAYDEDAYDALYWPLAALVEIVLMYALLRPLEALRPIERWNNRRAVRVDALYTWITRLGLFNFFFFLLLQPLFDRLQAWAHLHGFETRDLDNLWPGVTSQPLVAFLLYLVVLDFIGYWYHRLQHSIGVWWELHAVHHSQHQMSFWSDDRNHVLDDILQSAVFALVALAIGVEPSQFVALVLLGQVAQSIQHVNARLPFGPVLSRVVVSPTFHRRHHAIGLGHEGRYSGCNFGVLFPWWDMLFGTASWSTEPVATGIREPKAGLGGRVHSYGEGFWAHQWLAFKRIGRRLAGRGRGDYTNREVSR
ncbi:MAG: sterol desaturase family protein [Janthinobacterium lividum]